MRARALLERLPVPPAAELAQILIHTAFGRAALADQSAQAHRDAEQALRLAQWHGLQYEEMWASLVLGVLHEMAGKAHDGLAAVRHALDLAHTVADGDPLIRALFL